MAGFTPAPWEFYDIPPAYSEERRVMVYHPQNGGKSFVAELSGGSLYFHDATLANAHLIAAAPLMYEALKEGSVMLASVGGPQGPEWDMERRRVVLDRMLAALSKASPSTEEGEQK